MELCDDIVLDPNEERDNHGSRHTMFRAGSGVCRLQTDSNVEAKVDRLALSAQRENP
jgi:hypothetical protein